MPKKGIALRKNIAEKRDLIRRQNVKRHNEFAARMKLKNDQITAQKVATWQSEMDRLHGASVHGNGLDAIRFNRMNALKEIIGKYKSFNVTVMVSDEAHRNNIYQALKGHDDIKFVF